MLTTDDLIRHKEWLIADGYESIPALQLMNVLIDVSREYDRRDEYSDDGSEPSNVIQFPGGANADTTGA